MIFMTHPQHGAMNVYSVADSLAHQKNGWVESTTAQWLGAKAKPTDVLTVADVSHVVEAPKPRGRQANNKKSINEKSQSVYAPDMSPVIYSGA